MSFAIDNSTMIGDIQKIQMFQRHILEQIQPQGAYGKAIKGMAVLGQNYAMRVTHVDTGALKNTHMVEVEGLQGSIHIDPYARRGDGRSPAQYGPHEHNRGGGHDFYKRTVDEQGQQIGMQGLSILTEAIHSGR